MVMDTPFKITRRDDGILRLEYDAGADITLEVAKRSLEMANASAGRPYRLMVVVGEFKDVSADARTFLARASGPTAVAIVMLSPLARIVANVFLSTAKSTAYQIRAFSNEPDAVGWLSKAA